MWLRLCLESYYMCCECDKDCEIGKYMKNWKCMKSLVDDLVVTRDKIEDTLKSVLTNHNGAINYWLIAVVLLSIAYLLLLVAIIVKY